MIYIRIQILSRTYVFLWKAYMWTNLIKSILTWGGVFRLFFIMGGRNIPEGARGGGSENLIISSGAYLEGVISLPPPPDSSGTYAPKLKTPLILTAIKIQNMNRILLLQKNYSSFWCKTILFGTFILDYRTKIWSMLLLNF